MFVSKNAQGGGSKQEQLPTASLKPEPSCRKNPHKVPARKKQSVPIQRPQTNDDTIGPLADLFDRFAARTTISKKLPIRPLASNFVRSLPIVLSIIPFHQIRLNPGGGAKASQF